MTKWGDRPHWEFDGVLLGSDEHGDWIGIPAGTADGAPRRDVRRAGRPGRPGARPPAPAEDRGWLATFHAPRRAGAGLRRHDHPAGLGRRGAARGRPRPRRRPRHRPAGCGSTTRTSSPSTGSRSATPTRSSRLAMDSCDRVHAAVARPGDPPYDGSAQALAGAALRPEAVPSGLARTPGAALPALGAAGADPQRPDQARAGQPALQRRASRLSGWATYSPRITPEESRSRPRRR